MAIKGLEFSIEAKGLVRVADMLGRYAARLPRAMNTDIKTIAEDYAFEMAGELVRQNLIWKWKLLTSCVPKEIGKDTYAVQIPRYGFLLDKMKPHFAPMFKPSKVTGQVLAEWAVIKWGIPKEKLPAVIKVHPHPWMEAAFRRARDKLIRRLERGEFHKTIERKGR